MEPKSGEHVIKGRLLYYFPKQRRRLSYCSLFTYAIFSWTCLLQMVFNYLHFAV